MSEESKKEEPKVDSKEKDETVVTNEIDTPHTSNKILSNNVCSGQPSMTNQQLKQAFPELNQNLFKIKFEMSAGLGRSFNDETYIWAIKTFFQLCIRKDKTFKVLPINSTESGANTISHVDQIPLEKGLFEKGYAYDTYARANRISVKMIIATQYRFSEMFKDTRKRGGFFPILTKLKEKQMWVSQVESKNMGRTSFVGYLQYAHPYLTNQNETLNDLKKVSGIDDLTLEHHPVQTGRQGFRQGNDTHSTNRTLAWNIGAPQDIAAEVQRYLFENWAKIQANTMSNKLPEGSTLRKFLFIPNSPVLMEAKQRNIFIKDQNAFRHNYKAVTLLNTKTVDEEFELNEEECKQIGISCEGCKRRRMTIRKVMKTWKGTNGEKAIWDIERGIENRFHIIVFVDNIDGVRREAHNLLKLLRGREDFEDITGDWRAKVEGGDLIPTTNEYKNLLQSTAIRIEEDDTKSGEKESVDMPRKKKSTEKKQSNPWKKEFNVREVIAKPNQMEDGPSTMTLDTESVITLTYRDDQGENQSVQMTKKDMSIYNAIMQGVSKQMNEQKVETTKQQEKSIKAIEEITEKVNETSEKMKERQDENEEIVKSLKEEVQQQQQKIDQMDKNQGKRIEECQESVRSDIAELKELMLTMSGISTKQKRHREASPENQVAPSRGHESPTKKQMKNNQRKSFRAIPVQIKQELMEKAIATKEKQKEKAKANKDIEMIDLSAEESPKDSYKLRATTVQKRSGSSVVLLSLGRTAQSLGVGHLRPATLMRGQTDKSKSQTGRSRSLTRSPKAADGSTGKESSQRQQS